MDAQREALQELVQAHNELQARSWPGGPAQYEQQRDRLRKAWINAEAALASQSPSIASVEPVAPDGQLEFNEKGARHLQQLLDDSNTRAERLAVELERAKAMPMKYRRMEFNAQLQEEAKAANKRSERLEAALKELVEAHEAEAAANMTYENAQANFTDCRKERQAAFNASMRASAAEKSARSLLESK